jgi:beta-xylosidase
MSSHVSRRRPRVVVGAAVAALCVGCGGDGGETFSNPVHEGDFPDPFVLRVGATYYAYGTNGGGAEVRTLTSTDLVRWRPGPDALPEVGSWAYPGKTWAPEVLALDGGRYVLYYTANGGGQCVGRAVADSPGGPFVDRWREPLVCQRDEGGSIDASPFRDGDGSLYLYWKSDGNAIGHTTYLYGARLSPKGTELVGEPVRLAHNDAGWEGGVVEAPTMWLEDGRHYLFYSGEAYDGDLYAVGYATCDGPLGPCSDAAENPILKTACRAHGPGHQALVRDGEGDTWLVYHAWDPGFERRQLWLDRVRWDDGRPVVEGPTCAEQPAPR